MGYSVRDCNTRETPTAPKGYSFGRRGRRRRHQAGSDLAPRGLREAAVRPSPSPYCAAAAMRRPRTGPSSGSSWPTRATNVRNGPKRPLPVRIPRKGSCPESVLRRRLPAWTDWKHIRGDSVNLKYGLRVAPGARGSGHLGPSWPARPPMPADPALEVASAACRRPPPAGTGPPGRVPGSRTWNGGALAATGPRGLSPAVAGGLRAPLEGLSKLCRTPRTPEHTPQKGDFWPEIELFFVVSGLFRVFIG